MAVSILIDDTGQAWTANDPALMRRAGYADARVDFVTFAVAERGFIHLRSIEDGVRVTLSPGAFSRVSLAGALQALNDLAPPRILLVSRAGRGTEAELFTSVFAFIERAEQLAADPPIEIKVPRYSVQRGLRNLTTPPFALVRPIVDLWKQRRGELGEEVHQAVLRAGLFHRTILARQVAGSSRLITEHFGSGIKVMLPCEHLLIVGRELSQQPDREYGAWMEQAYAETGWARRPRLESVRALVRTSAGATLRTRYDRVLLPWQQKGELFVMCLSIQREVPAVVAAT
ncbi:MAG TPA: hypothetical protein VN681_12825 [Stellaceae bacterium]|nr:hypothetical protein [Stellaceae bacterium]